MSKLRWKPLLVNLAIPLAVGGAAGLLTMNGAMAFNSFAKPPLSPPGWIFPVVWTLLYTLMGVSAYLVWVSDAPPEKKRTALALYAAQLAVNFAWPIIFFNAKLYYASFVWIILLIALAAFMVFEFKKLDARAAQLQIPYLVWLAFASYLNLGVALLNA